jgi:CBS domain containing-hemolysin-like protein
MFLSILLVFAFLLLVNAFYVAAELGMVAARRSRVHQLANEGNWLAARLKSLIDVPAELDRAIAACQIGITISSLVLGAYGQAQLAPLLAPLFEDWGGLATAAAHSASVIVVLVVLTVAQMILGELLPKSIALEYPVRAALFTAVPIGWSMRFLSPLLYLFNGSGLLLLKLLRITPTRHRHVHSPAEIDLLLAESPSDEELDAGDRRRLRRALRLGAQRARDLMVPLARITAIDISTPPAECLRQIAEGPFTRLPVYRGSLDDVLGVLHTKDVLLRHLEGEEPRPFADLVRPLVTVPALASADQVLVMLRERRAQLALVTDERDKIIGLITLYDLLSAVFGALEGELGRLPSGRPGRARRGG